MLKPFLLTLEYPPQIGGVAKYLEGEVKNFDGDVVVKKARPMMWILWPKWLPLVWRPRPDYKKQVCGTLWISHVLPIGYVALVWKRLFKTPYRLYVHGLDLARPLKSRWKKFWVKRILSAADEIVANSNATACLLTNYGLNPARARVQYPRLEKIDPSPYDEAGKRLRQNYSISGKPLLLTIGRLVKRKGVDLVLQALPAVWREIPNLVYVIIGDGEERKKIDVIASAALAERSNLNDAQSDGKIASASPRNDKIYPRVIFTGPVSEQEKYGWLSACDCFILTPINDPNDFEGYGIVYKEARMFAKPVIASRVGGVPEAVGENGALVEPGSVEQIAKAVIVSLRPRRKPGEAIPMP